MSRFDGGDVDIWDNNTSAWIDTFASGDSIDLAANDATEVDMGIDSNEKHTEELLEIASALEKIDPTSADGPLLKGLFFEVQGRRIRP